MTKSRKGQVALEALVVFGILIIGVVIFGLFFMGNIKEITTTDPGTKQDKNTGGDIYDTLEGSLIYDDEQQIGSSSFGLGGGTSSGGTGGTGGSGDDDGDGGDETPTCGNGVCDLNLGETLLNCPEDCTGGYGSFCGDGICDDGENCPQDCGVLEFISVWDTSLSGSGLTRSNEILLPLINTGIYDFNVDWGDGTSTHIFNEDNRTVLYSETGYYDGLAKHEYARPGEYIVTITGTIKGFTFVRPDLMGGFPIDALKLKEIRRWGPLRLGDYTGHFKDAQNLIITATDLLDTSDVRDMSEIFRNCSSLTQIPRINEWNTSNVRNMSYMFYNAQNFNQTLSFNTTNVTDMSYMFYNADSFNSPLILDTSNVRDMRGMFDSANNFNQSLSFNTINVTDMSFMFRSAEAFNSPLNFDTSNVSDMYGMFIGAHQFNQSLNTWNVSNVTNMIEMFSGAYNFNQPLNNWDTSQVEDMRFMFNWAGSFNQDISNWNVNRVTDWDNIFADCPIQTSYKPPKFR